MPDTGRVTPKSLIKNARAIEVGKAAIMTDPARPGLRLVSKDERRSWVYRYRTATGLRQIKLGDYSLPGSKKIIMTWEAAQSAWMRLKVAKDDPTVGDPVEAIREKKEAKRAEKSRERERTSLTMGRIIDDYLAEVVERQRQAKGATEVSRMLNAPAVEKIRKIPLAEFDRKAAAALIKKIAAGQRKKPAPRVAHMTRQELRAAWVYAKQNGVAVGENPFEGDKLGGVFKFEERERQLSEHEAVTLLRWMRTPAAYSRTVADALELTLRTGLRSGEVCEIHSSELQRRDGVLWLDIPASRMKNKKPHSLPLVGRAQEIVLTRMPDKPGFLFKGRRGAIAQKVLGVEIYAHSGRSTSKVYEGKRICPVDNFTAHDLRRTARQLLASIGCPFEVAETILAHKLPKVQRTYLRVDRLPKLLIEWLAKLGEHIDSLQPAEPVVLHRAA
jgi:integrase